MNFIFLLGCHKSGTSLLRSLLHGHERLEIIPIESHFFEHLGLASLDSLRYKGPSKEVDSKESINSLLEDYRKGNNPYSDFHGGPELKAEFSGNLHKDKLSKYLNFIYSQYTGNNLEEGKTVVEKSVENYQFAPYLKLLYPSIKFIHIIRDPYSNLHSLKNYLLKSRGNYPSIIELVYKIRLSLFYAYNNSKILSDYKIVKYEELIDDPKGTMMSISEYLQIPYTESLLQPTTVKGDWEGNSTYDLKYKGISLSTGYDIDSLLISYVNKVLKEYMNYHNYPILDDRGFQKLLPREKEKFKTFIRNRVGLLFNRV